MGIVPGICNTFLGEYNADQDAASLAYGNTTMFYDYDNQRLAYKQVWDNTTDGTVKYRRIVIQYMAQSKVGLRIELQNKLFLRKWECSF